MQKIAVFLMAHGAPESLDDVAPYLQHIMKGRPLSQEILEQIIERYRLVGGKSPLLQITKQQAAALETRLNQLESSETQDKKHFKVYIGMRHWHPFIHETVKEMLLDQPAQVIAISLAPQYSKLSVDVYNETLKRALAENGSNLPVQFVKSWHDQTHLIAAFVARIAHSLAQYPEAERKTVQIIFTAHSLPAHVLADGDPYPGEVAATVALIVKKLELGPEGKRWQFAYQSRGFRPGKWLEPEIDDVIDQLANEGASNLLVVPIGFVSDHVEILYDIDILYKGMAASKGMTLRRTDSPNTIPHFINALAEVVQNRL